MTDEFTWMEVAETPPETINKQRIWVVLSMGYEFIIALRAASEDELFTKLKNIEKTAVSHWHMIFAFDDDGVKLKTINRVDVDQIYARKIRSKNEKNYY